ncbi:HEAT repeat domain-containing protein [uncultured Microbacterium sp.]|uniref:HEAT repeat domain-containing protein n=1 Tax=uncultured Microbacterium sp. TaxID=191216 RepID=UPI0028D1F875|nr:HEAT repeat domain-containing protein [uncultured Microbacterium sp.]
MGQLPASGARPNVLAASAVDLFGREHVVHWCEELLSGAASDSDPQFPDIAWLGGTVGWPDYWSRVWGARGLLHIGPPARGLIVLNGVRDGSWRVREMSLKVIARYQLSDPVGIVDGLTEDPVERVRVAAWKALGREPEPR